MPLLQYHTSLRLGTAAPVSLWRADPEGGVLTNTARAAAATASTLGAIPKLVVPG